MARPLIAVTAAKEQLPTAFGEIDCTKLAGPYTDAVYAAGGQPVILPVVSDPPAGLLDRIDGLVLTGGGDISPALYGEEPDETVYGVRPDRDLFESQLYNEAIAAGIPILAICRGLQLVNILRGGTLFQEIPDHWQQNPPTASHQVTVVAGSALADAAEQAGDVGVNSYHHQAIDRLGAGLQVTAVAGEIIEAAEATDADIVGVQWHPEHMAATDRTAHRLFESLVARAAIRSTHAQEQTACQTT